MTDEINKLLKGIRRRNQITLRRLDSMEKALEEYSAECPRPEKAGGIFEWFLALIGRRKRRSLDDDAA